MKHGVGVSLQRVLGLKLSGHQEERLAEKINLVFLEVEI